MMAHDILSPSSAGTWMRCPGAPCLYKDIPSTDSAYTREGTEAHEQAERAVTARLNGARFWETNGNAEMVEHAEGWANACVEVCGGRGNIQFAAAEKSLAIGGITGRAGAEGTADFIGITKDSELVIADFKYGMGVDVSAERNLQLSIYAAAALAEYELMFDIKTVCLMIYQPRITRTPKTYRMTVNQLKAVARRIRSGAEVAASMLNDREAALSSLRPGEEQCRFCRAKGECPALRAKTQELVKAQFTVIEDKPEPLPMPTTEEELARALPWLDTIEGWCSAVRARALDLATQGKEIPGYKVVQGRKGIRKWTPDAEEQIRGMRISRAVLYTKTLISPAQAEKAHKAGSIGPRQWAQISQLITQADGKPTLVPSADKRPAIANAVADQFQIIND